MPFGKNFYRSAGRGLLRVAGPHSHEACTGGEQEKTRGSELQPRIAVVAATGHTEEARHPFVAHDGKKEEQS